MCRALRSRQPQQSPKTDPPTTTTTAAEAAADYVPLCYADRLDRLRRVLKPYRDNNAANRLRSGRGSARVNLNRHWKSLENLLAPNHRKERDQNAVDEKLRRLRQQQEDAENAGPADDPTADATERLHALDVGR